MVEVLNAIYEQDFLECSYGFRPGRGAHQALDEVGRVICTRPTEWILELDITTYFDSIVREQLIEMIEKRVSDGSVLRLIRKWIQVGVIDEGRLLVSETGTGQGQTISPLLANIYLHYILDEWFEEVVKPRLKGEAHEIRFADDAILCFQYREDAEKVMNVLPKRFAKYGLTLHPEKTRLVEFGRNAGGNAKRQGNKPSTFDFLGLTHICARSRRGKFTVHVRTMRKRLSRSLTAVARWCQEHRHEEVGQQQKTLNAKLRGHYQYYGRPTNFLSLRQFYRGVRRAWRKWLSRRTRGRWLTWANYLDLLRRHPLLPPRIMHSWATTGSPAWGTRCGKSARRRSVRGELPKGYGRPKRARSWKRRIQPRKTYRLTGSPLLGASVLKKKIQPAFRRIGITGVGWHTFRHSVGTMLAEMGEHQLTIRDYLRHSNLHVTNKYLQATSKTKRLAQDKLVDAILPTGILPKTNLIQWALFGIVLEWNHSRSALIVP
jgi:RNA-directed DNA polymerase